MEDYKFKKSTCERYDIRFGSYGWAIFTIDENGGLFHCQSDYGDYSYLWPKHGRKSFKHFLIEITRSTDYLLGKISRETHFDFDKCLRLWKKEIIKMRKEEEYSKEELREAWDFIENIDSGMPCECVQNELYDSREISKICGGEPWYVFETDKDYPPSAVVFAKEVMPIFAEILKNEINEIN